MNNLATIEHEQYPSSKPLTALDIQNQVNVIQHVMKQVMKQDTHFGIIPGTKTPSLYKPGAEKIMATFRLSADPEVSDLSDSDQIRYQVKVRLVSPTGAFVGAGIGECSSNEEKYKWRRAVCQEEFDETEPGRKREKWCKGWNKPNYKQQQIRTEPADLANTILKMAKKRALIDAVLTATAASDCFTQDIEDLPPEYVQGEEMPASNLPDITDALIAIGEASSMEALQKTFGECWKRYTHKELRARLTAAKDAKKKELTNA